MYAEASIPYHKQTVATKIVNSFNKFENIAISPTILLNHIKKLAGKDVIISGSRSDQVDPNTLVVSGYYDPDADENNDKPFELVVIFNTEDKSVKLNKSEWKNFAAEIISILKHEMIHQAQYRNRGYKAQRSYISKIKDPEIKRNQEYLGNPDEIDAYSYDLADELLRKTHNDHEQVLRLLRNFSKTALTKDQAGRLLSPNLFGYFKDFGFDTNHPVLKTLMKKTYSKISASKRQLERKDRVEKRNSEIEKSTKDFLDRKEALDKQLRTAYTSIISD